MLVCFDAGTKIKAAQEVFLSQKVNDKRWNHAHDTAG